MYIRNTTFKKFLYMLGIPKDQKTYNIGIPNCVSQFPNSVLIHFSMVILLETVGFQNIQLDLDSK